VLTQLGKLRNLLLQVRHRELDKYHGWLYLSTFSAGYGKNYGQRIVILYMSRLMATSALDVGTLINCPRTISGLPGISDYRPPRLASPVP
jgi:hypothetical protein